MDIFSLGSDHSEARSRHFFSGKHLRTQLIVLESGEGRNAYRLKLEELTLLILDGEGKIHVNDEVQSYHKNDLIALMEKDAFKLDVQVRTVVPVIL